MTHPAQDALAFIEMTLRDAISGHGAWLHHSTGKELRKFDKGDVRGLICERGIQALDEDIPLVRQALQSSSLGWIEIAKHPRDGEAYLVGRFSKGKWYCEVCRWLGEGDIHCDIGTPTHFQHITPPKQGA